MENALETDRGFRCHVRVGLHPHAVVCARDAETATCDATWFTGGHPSTTFPLPHVCGATAVRDTSTAVTRPVIADITTLCLCSWHYLTDRGSMTNDGEGPADVDDGDSLSEPDVQLRRLKTARCATGGAVSIGIIDIDARSSCLSHSYSCSFGTAVCPPWIGRDITAAIDVSYRRLCELAIPVSRISVVQMGVNAMAGTGPLRGDSTGICTATSFVPSSNHLFRGYFLVYFTVVHLRRRY